MYNHPLEQDKSENQTLLKQQQYKFYKNNNHPHNFIILCKFINNLKRAINSKGSQPP